MTFLTRFRNTSRFFLLLSLLAQTSPSFAMQPLRDSNLLWDARKEQVVGVASARVALADYNLIRQDFPEVRGFSNTEIDQWLVANTAFVSKPQVAQDIVNDPIPTTGEEREAYRPREYRRAHVFKMNTGGLIDAKGTGALDPEGGSHDNGLATLGDMIREFTFEKLIYSIFERDGRFDTVRSYAVIDSGFNVKHPDGGHSRAGTILRQAHVRYHDGPAGIRHRGQTAMLPRGLQLQIELFLRRFGITSVVREDSEDMINLQGSESGAVIDFGSFLVQTKFTQRLVFFYDQEGNPNGQDLIAAPGKAGFVQPIAKLQIPFDVWGYSQSGREDPKYDNPYTWAHEVAEAYATGRANRDAIEHHLRNMLQNPHVQEVLRSIPRHADVLSELTIPARPGTCEAIF